jgi:hypothetical protein
MHGDPIAFKSSRIDEFSPAEEKEIADDVTNQVISPQVPVTLDFDFFGKKHFQGITLRWMLNFGANI